MRPRHHRSRAVSARARPRNSGGAPAHGARGLRARLLHGVHRRLRAHGRAAQAARRARRRSGRSAVGAQRLRSGAGVADIDRRRAGRCPWQSAHAWHWLPAVRRGIGCLRAGAVRDLAHRRACLARHRRGAADAGESGPDRRDLPQGRAQPRDRRVGGRIGPDHRRRPGARRLADRDIRLAGGVLDQPADRRRRGRRALGLRARGPARAAPVRPDRRRHHRRGARSAGLGAEPDRAERSNRGVFGVRHDGRLCRPAWRRRPCRLRLSGSARARIR